MPSSPDLPIEYEAESSPTVNHDGETSPTVEDIIADHATSDWLKGALESALERDPVDALNDALILAAVLERHLRDALELDVD